MHRHIVGIDLGTTHCAVALRGPRLGARARPMSDFPVPQLVAAGRGRRRGRCCPRLYVPARPRAGRRSALRAALGRGRRPTSSASSRAGRARGSRAGSSPRRRAGCATRASIAPRPSSRGARRPTWRSSRRWRPARAPRAPGARVGHRAPGARRSREQEVVITVPASFDEAARALTVSAARQGGPGAASPCSRSRRPPSTTSPPRHRQDLAQRARRACAWCWSWTSAAAPPTSRSCTRASRRRARAAAPRGRRAPDARRRQHGRRARHAAWSRSSAGGRRLSATAVDPAHPGRAHREGGAARPEARRSAYGVSLVAEGSRLLGGTLSAELTREEAEALVLDGFFPRVEPRREPPRSAARMALQELGLPYAQDPAITRHLAAFLAPARGGGLRGARRAPPARTPCPAPTPSCSTAASSTRPRSPRGCRTPSPRWWPEQPRIRCCEHGSLDLAVARGAAYYGLVRRGHWACASAAARRAPTTSALETPERRRQQAAVPHPARLRGGPGGRRSASAPSRSRSGGRCSSRSTRPPRDRIDAPGRRGRRSARTFQPLPPIHTLLRGARSGKAHEVPVHLAATLDRDRHARAVLRLGRGDERWRLEFELRGTGGEAGLTVTESHARRASPRRREHGGARRTATSRCRSAPRT